jgi:hypothetical protein
MVRVPIRASREVVVERASWVLNNLLDAGSDLNCVEPQQDDAQAGPLSPLKLDSQLPTCAVHAAISLARA